MEIGYKQKIKNALYGSIEIPHNECSSDIQNTVEAVLEYMREQKLYDFVNDKDKTVCFEDDFDTEREEIYYDFEVRHACTMRDPIGAPYYGNVLFVQQADAETRRANLLNNTIDQHALTIQAELANIAHVIGWSAFWIVLAILFI